MKSVKVREVAEALRTVRLEIGVDGAQLYLTEPQAEMLAGLAIRALVTPTEEMLRTGVEDMDLWKADAKKVWEAMCQEALR